MLVVLLLQWIGMLDCLPLYDPLSGANLERQKRALSMRFVKNLKRTAETNLFHDLFQLSKVIRFLSIIDSIIAMIDYRYLYVYNMAMYLIIGAPNNQKNNYN